MRDEAGGVTGDDAGGPMRAETGGWRRDDAGVLTRHHADGPTRDAAGGPTRDAAGGPAGDDEGRPMRVLVSVRDVAEARLAAAAGVDFVDCKEPGAGALGALPVATIRAIVAALRDAGFGGATSATVGDLPTPGVDGAAPSAFVDEALARVAAVAAAGVSFVKVGVEPGAAAPSLLRALAGCGRAVVPVFVADRGIDGAALALALALGFPALMADTAAKRAGSLLDLVPRADLRRFVTAARAAGVPVGLAGALRRADLPRLGALAPDFAGFRSAVCAGDRAGALDADRLQGLVGALRSRGPAQGAAGAGRRGESGLAAVSRPSFAA